MPSSAGKKKHRRPTGPRDGGVCRRRIPDLQVTRRRLRARALLRQGPRAAGTRGPHVRRRDLAAEPGRPGGRLPVRRRLAPAELPVPELELFKGQLEGTGDREISTTMAFVRVLAALLRDKQLGRHVVPFVPDESPPISILFPYTTLFR